MIPPGIRCSVHVAYYLWYGNPETDGKWMHWDHKTLPHWDPAIDRKHPPKRWEPPVEAHSPFRPARGLYSSADPVTVDAHFAELASMGIDSAMFSWWGRSKSSAVTKRDDADSGADTDRLLPLVLAAARRHKVDVSFHIEPYGGRSPETFLDDARHLLEQKGHVGTAEFAPHGGGDVVTFFVYDVSSRHTPPPERKRWKLTFETLREEFKGLSFELVFFCLWMENRGDAAFVREAGFDAGYSYFAATGFTPASSPTNWPGMPRDLFVPSVGPGYDDSMIRPWNTHNIRPRTGSQYYDSMWASAMDFDMVTITSYNEWGEGTQIEPAVQYESPKPGSNVHYVHYPDNDPNFFVKRTQEWVRKYKAHCRIRWNTNELLEEAGEGADVNIRGDDRSVRQDDEDDLKKSKLNKNGNEL
ncbi:unnamed protein product [Amoebophrya sp. A25]|nr:unnamed protein product [Amoebophrya sp. A25]|eukprot:GSA25T00005631001.1